MFKMLKYSLVVILILFGGCKINFSFSGASIAADLKTFSVLQFPNRAPMFQPTISFTFTNELKDKIQSRTSLRLVNNNSDVSFEGEITNYNVTPQAIQGNAQAAQNRLTVSVRVKYTNEKYPDQSYDQVFTRYEDFSSDQSLSQVENDMIKSIVEQLTDDIFNKAFVNW